MTSQSSSSSPAAATATTGYTAANQDGTFKQDPALLAPSSGGDGEEPESQGLWAKFTAALHRLRVDDLSDHSTHAQNLYDTIDDWEAVNILGRAYTVYHPLEPRWLIWFFLILIPVIVGFVVAFIDQSLVALFRIKHEYIAEPMATWAGDNGWKMILCAGAWGALGSFMIACSYFWSKWLAFGTAGRGMPRVLANLNGVYMPHWGHWRILFSKIFSCMMTVISGIPFDFVGNILEIGAMIGATSISRHPIYQKLVPFSRYFRNARDSRLIVSIGIAAAAAAAFKSPIGGLALLIELSAVKFNIKFLYRVFLATNICGFVVQIIYTHIYGWETRPSSGKWALLPLSQLAQVQENLLTLFPSIFLGLVGGLFQGVFAIMSNFVLNRPALKSIECLLFVAFMYGVMIYIFSGIFGLTDQCRPYTEADPEVLQGTPVFLHTKMFCSEKSLASSNSTMNFSTSTTTTLPATTTTTMNPNMTTLAPSTPQGEPVYINAFASLTLGFDSSILRILFRRRVTQFWTAPELGLTIFLFCLMLPFLTVLSIVDGDVLLPTGLLGGCVGQLVFIAVKSWGIDAPWVDGGLFSLLGAVSFIGGMTRLTFSLTFLFVDFAGDVRHVLFIMMSISVARAVADRVAPVRIDYIVMKYQGFAILDFALKIEKYDSITLHEFQQKDIKVIPPTCTVAQLVRLLKTSFHNAFPVIDPVSQRFIGLVHRRTLLLIVWAFSEKLPPEFQHPDNWPGLLSNSVNNLSSPRFTSHNYGATQANVSSAVHSFKMERPSYETSPRAQYESYFDHHEGETEQQQQQGVFGESKNNAIVSQATISSSNEPTTGSPVISASSALPGTGNTPLGSPSPSSTTFNKRQQQENRDQQNAKKTAAVLEDYDHFDEFAASVEYHRLRDLDDYLHVTYDEDDATLIQFTHGTVIKIENSKLHHAFLEETDLFSDAVKGTQINLARYTDRACFTVRANMVVSRLYNMFTVLGLRHATIVDYNNRPTGVITRRDLMTYKIIEKKRKQTTKWNYERLKTGGVQSQGGNRYDDNNKEDDSDNNALLEEGIALGDGIDSEQAFKQSSAPPQRSSTKVGAGVEGESPLSKKSGAGKSVVSNEAFPSSDDKNPSLSRFYDEDEAETNFIPPPESSPLKENNKKKGSGSAFDQQNQQQQSIAENEVPMTPTNREQEYDEHASDRAGTINMDAFEGKVLYQVNRMRPPMLLPRGWNGSGAGVNFLRPGSNNNADNNNVNATSAAAAAAGGGGGGGKGSAVEKNNNDERGDDNDSDSRQSFSTVMSEPPSDANHHLHHHQEQEQQQQSSSSSNSEPEK